jgi:hypothetical protein
MMKALGITPTETESIEGLATAPPPNVLRQQARMRMAAATTRAGGLKQHPAVKDLIG